MGPRGLLAEGEAVEVQAIIGRLMDEELDLELKIDRLSSFLEQDETMDLVGPYHHQLLMAQRHSMQEYKKILGIRVEDLESKL